MKINLLSIGLALLGFSGLGLAQASAHETAAAAVALPATVHVDEIIIETGHHYRHGYYYHHHRRFYWHHGHRVWY